MRREFREGEWCRSYLRVCRAHRDLAIRVHPESTLILLPDPGNAGSEWLDGRMTQTPLTRSADDRVLAGVCAGLATHLGLPVRSVRIAMVVFALLGGAGVLFYAWLWALVPVAGEGQVAPMRKALMKPTSVGERSGAARGASAAEAQQSTRESPESLTGAGDGAIDSAPSLPSAFTRRVKRWPVAELLLGACLVIAGFGLVLTQLGVQIRLDVLVPAMAVLVGVGLTWWQIADRNRPDRALLPRVLGALALVAVGVLMFFVTAQQPSVFTVIGAAIAVLAGVALALAPWALRLNRELIAERSARARETERAEIAAHLHDSVLQTLAAIQQRSEPGSEVARLARGQERELRDWLFRAADGGAAADSEALADELREHAALLESDHAVRFEVVSVGVARAVPESIVAASREAMLNAARHAGGDVTVYIETRPDEVLIDITDRGAGLDLTDLPEGRMGVRESIIGRMQRAGGEARITPGPGGAGTAVRLSLPLSTQEEVGNERAHAE